MNEDGGYGPIDGYYEDRCPPERRRRIEGTVAERSHSQKADPPGVVDATGFGADEFEAVAVLIRGGDTPEKAIYRIHRLRGF
jgi:hypothetical protein